MKRDEIIEYVKGTFENYDIDIDDEEPSSININR